MAVVLDTNSVASITDPELHRVAFGLSGVYELPCECVRLCTEERPPTRKKTGIENEETVKTKTVLSVFAFIAVLYF